MSTVRLIITTGLSGSGKSVALHTLEDAGFYCIDNLPVRLLRSFAAYAVSSGTRTGDRFAVGVDARNPPADLQELPEILKELEEDGFETRCLFLYAEERILMQRYSETRRRHPLADEGRSLADALRMEREILEPLRDRADWVMDTSRTYVHGLRQLVQKRLVDAPPQLSILVESFGYKHGVPTDADYVFDARCLPNPHWEPQLRPYTGRDAPVQAFLESLSDTNELYEQIRGMLRRWLPRYVQEGRTYVTAAIGCTGGQHRSVYLAERLARDFRDHDYHVVLKHRELE